MARQFETGTVALDGGYADCAGLCRANRQLYAHGMAKRMFGVDQVHWLSDDKLHKLVAALQIYANRRKGENNVV